MLNRKFRITYANLKTNTVTTITGNAFITLLRLIPMVSFRKWVEYHEGNLYVFANETEAINIVRFA